MPDHRTPAKDGGAVGNFSRTSFVVLYMLIVTALSTAVFFFVVASRVIDLTALRKEQASLLEVSGDFQLSNSDNPPHVDTPDANDMKTGWVIGAPVTGVPNPESIISDNESGAPPVSAFDTKMREINADYLCWVKIDGTAIDYPVVRGTDNEKYLHTSFYGEENWYGALFMDYRNTGERVPHIIIYGHNVKSGDMFGGLRNFLDAQYRDSHPLITVTANDRITQYEIFAARRTDIDDPAYFLDFDEPGSFGAFAERCGAPAGTAQIITLSTCVSAGDDDERMVVQAALCP